MMPNKRTCRGRTYTDNVARFANLNSEMTVSNGNVGRGLQRLTRKSIPRYESPGDHVNTEYVAEVSGRSLMPGIVWGSLMSECLGEVYCLNVWVKFTV